MNNLEYWLLKTFWSRTKTGESVETQTPKIASVWPELDFSGKTVIDFGCGKGEGAIECAQLGARKVIGLDIQESGLEIAREQAKRAGVDNICVFTTETDVRADFIISINAFEHYTDPEGVLARMRQLLKPDGSILIDFGPPWLHPYGGHLFAVFPWAHLVFTEKALIRWRSDFKNDGATRFEEVAGGLNRMTIWKFEQLVAKSPFRLDEMKLVPIRAVRRFHRPWNREYFTSVVQCRLT